MPGLLGKKIGMTRVYDEQGRSVPVTVLRAGPCPVLQVKTQETDGYNAAQIGFEELRRGLWKKPQAGHCRKAQARPHRFVREVRSADPPPHAPGEVLTVALMKDVPYVDVIGTTKGKGFQGVMRRWGFRGLPASHGTERKHRSPGSIGAGTATGASIRKGKHMAGQMGHKRQTVRNSRVVGVDEENNLILVKGAVPGPNGGYVIIRPALALDALVRRDEHRAKATETHRARREEKARGRQR